jgi:hypothetical protein
LNGLHGRPLDVLTAFGPDVWVFTIDNWFARDPGGNYVA